MKPKLIVLEAKNKFLDFSKLKIFHTINSEPLNLHIQTIFRLKQRFFKRRPNRFWRLTSIQHKIKFQQQPGQCQFSLSHSKSESNTYPRSLPKRNECARMPFPCLFWRESLGIKDFWIWIELRVVMYSVNWNLNDCSFINYYVGFWYFVVSTGDSDC